MPPFRSRVRSDAVAFAVRPAVCDAAMGRSELQRHAPQVRSVPALTAVTDGSALAQATPRLAREPSAGRDFIRMSQLRCRHAAHFSGFIAASRRFVCLPTDRARSALTARDPALLASAQLRQGRVREARARGARRRREARRRLRPVLQGAAPPQSRDGSAPVQTAARPAEPHRRPLLRPAPAQHIFVPNFVGAAVGALAITDANRHLLRSGYSARKVAPPGGNHSAAPPSRHEISDQFLPPPAPFLRRRRSCPFSPGGSRRRRWCPCPGRRCST